jgi:hypothetical protein
MSSEKKFHENIFEEDGFLKFYFSNNWRAKCLVTLSSVGESHRKCIELVKKQLFLR